MKTVINRVHECSYKFQDNYLKMNKFSDLRRLVSNLLHSKVDRKGLANLKVACMVKMKMFFYGQILL